MPLNRPYYELHQIETGKYARPGDYILESGEDYIGLYHTLPDGTNWTKDIPEPNSKKLFDKRTEQTSDVKTYRQINGFKENQYVSPKYHRPQVTSIEKEDGILERFFVQKMNNPHTTIIEIDAEQFNSINTRNKPGIDGSIWKGCKVDWAISGENIIERNKTRVQQAQVNFKFKYLERYLDNYLEFSL